MLRLTFLLLLAAAGIGTSISFTDDADAAGGLSITHLTWDSVGLSNNTSGLSTGPERFPVGVRVCNSSSSALSNVRTSFAWNTANSYVALESPAGINLDSLDAGKCADAYYTVVLSKNSAAWDTARKYQITVQADGGVSAVTALNRQIYVEKMSTTANAISKISGPGGCNADFSACDSAPVDLQLGRSYTFKFYATTPQADEQVEIALGLPGNAFRIQSVHTEYQTPAGAAVDAAYADACGWQAITNISKYRTCSSLIVEPFKPNGKAGGGMVSTYRVLATGAGEGDIKPLVYNSYSGNVQYNSDFSDSKKWLHYNARYPLDVIVNGQGVVTSDLGGINCGSGNNVCNAGFDPNSKVTLVAKPASGQEFGGWSGDCSGSSLTCQVSFNQAKSVKAQFAGKTMYGLAASVSGQGTVSSNPMGIDCGTSNSGECNARFAKGTPVELQPLSVDGWQFQEWTGDCTGSSACQIVMDGSKSVGVVFAPKPPSVFKLAIDNLGGGSVVSRSTPDNPLQIDCGKSCSADYPISTQVDLAPTAEPGYRFAGWQSCTQSGDTVTYDNHCQLTVTGGRAINAKFEPIPRYALNVALSGHGLVQSSPEGINCVSDCQSDFQEGTAVALTPTPDPGWQFVEWQGDCSGDKCRVDMKSSQKVSAVFAPVQYEMAVAVIGSGSLASDPKGIECENSCINNYDSGTVVSLLAHPTQGWRIKSWSGDCDGSALSCKLTLDQARKVQVEFEPIPIYSLQVGSTGQGSVSSQDDSLRCPVVCAAQYDDGSKVTLIATPSKEWQFQGWSGDCQGTEVCTLTLDQSKKVHAAFSLVQHKLDIQSTEGGKVISMPDEIDCDNVCSKVHDSGANLSLRALPQEGWRLQGWGGDCQGESDCVLVMDKERSVVARFEKIPVYVLSSSASEGGSVNLSPEGEGYLQGTKVGVEATAQTGYKFAGWSGDCAGTDACFLSMDSDKKVYAQFERIRYKLSVSSSGDGKISSLPEGINCGDVCQSEFDSNTQVALKAQSGKDQYFVGWSGAGCSGRAATCSVPMSQLQNVSARFQPLPRKELQIAVQGAGTVHSLFGTIMCNSRCSGNYPITNQITLQAIPFAGQQFAGWSGDCSGQGVKCIVSMSSARSVVAHFEPIPIPSYNLTVQLSGLGQVTANPDGINCGLICQIGYTQNTLVRLQATGLVGYRFDGWNGDCFSKTSSCVVKMNQARMVSARFVAAPPRRVRVRVLPSGAARVWSEPKGIDCAGTCSGQFAENQQLELFQQARPGYRFIGWTGACKGTGGCRRLVDRVLDVYAVYAKAS